ncbi:hypothetical protein SODALDRAFT_325084 [Sodiomyces alkalinus F11]|uniref:Uncharacterized protein n=1 Tax=Sodiomyces alkalinus (strain CBS 110278 / VKM F-3762 / F11) TaxID=1314773 RepID=A0A3N2PT46_SODAK|nr:hypothetical protein SODALDRAFT_325084 [Sodiomyces alkalinus F11]ROT37486.1 hypothetical protein SODALDRAFT_325084 [Sodiomyces alkalinus F11]
MAAIIVGPLIKAAFGENVSDVADVILGFDFSKMDVTTTHSEEYLHTELAPSYGKLTSSSLEELDDHLKIMMSGTMKSLAKLENKDWASVVGTMMQNPLLETDGSEIDRSDMLIKDSVADFKFDGSPDSAIVSEVQSWFTKLINDEDVLLSTKIDLPIMAQIVASSGATVDSFLNFWAKRERHSQTMVDIGVLRFPDVDHPHFKLYRIQLEAWQDSSRILWHQEDKNGITGIYTCRRFKPRESVIKGLTDTARAKAIEEANKLFD